MITKELIQDIGKYARVLVKNSPDEDYRDLVQSTCERLLRQDATKHNFKYASTVCINMWRDKLVHKAIQRNLDLLVANNVVCFLPQVLEEIECKEQGKDIHDWELPSRTIQQEKARLRMARLYAKRKGTLRGKM